MTNTPKTDGDANTGDRSARLADLLAQTSRTFALSIPLLAPPLRNEVTIAYLLFRIADTIEDEVDWPDADKAGALRVFSSVLSDGDFRAVAPGLLKSMANARVNHAGYATLMADSLFVLESFSMLDATPRAAIAKHLSRTAAGMADQIESGTIPGDVAGAQAYCYAVAGIVGELCTELFIGRNERLASKADQLMTLAPIFGEGLQLVNILRDERDDAEAGRRYIPEADCRAELLSLARRDLLKAAEYVRTLEDNGANPGTVAFNALNVGLAFETLSLVSQTGPGAKVSKERVAEMFENIKSRAAAGSPISPLIDQSAACER